MSLNELGEKSQATIILGKICKQVIIKLSLAQSSRKMFFIGQNLKHKAHSYDIFFSWTFDLLLINSTYLVFVVYFSPHQRNIFLYVNTNVMGNQSWNTNHELLSDIDVEKKLFFIVKLKLNSFWFSSVWWTSFQQQPFKDVL